MRNHSHFKKSSIVLAVASAFPLAFAHADDDLVQQTNPNITEISVKIPFHDKTGQQYRQYSGATHDGLNGNLDIQYINRTPDGVWTKFEARELGLRTQELGGSYEKQGDWQISIDYNQIPHYAPYDIQTAVSGIGKNTITQPSYANSAFSGGALKNPVLGDVKMHTERDITTFTAKKFIFEGLSLAFSFKNEDKSGIRMDGVRGVAGSAGTPTTGTANLYSGYLFTPEPIDQNHKQFEFALDYVTSVYQLTAGYYGSFLNTKYSYLNVVGGTNTMPVSTTPVFNAIGLAPDNQMQQVYVNGAYNFSSSTRGTLKVAYSEGKQNDTFMPGQVTASPTIIGTNLDAKVTNTEIYASLTSRVTRDLKLLGSWRYEDKDDKTPIRTFYTNYANNPESHKASWGKAEADYNLGSGYGLNGGFDYTDKKSNEWERHRVEDLTSRIALRKMMSETLNGSLSYAHSDRTGSDWEGTTQPQLYPVYLADRKRDKIRGMLDWTVNAQLGIQFAVETYKDDYDHGKFGLVDGDGQMYSVDATYAINDDWKLNAWYSIQNGKSNQNVNGSVCSTGNNSNCTLNTNRSLPIAWDATLKLKSDQFGVGLNGVVGMFSVGAQFAYMNDRNSQTIGGLPTSTWTSATVQTPVAANMGILPDTHYKQNTLKLYGVYALSKATKLRLDYIHDRRTMDDYTWQNWVYADGTRVNVSPKETVQLLGLTIIQSF